MGLNDAWAKIENLFYDVIIDISKFGENMSDRKKGAIKCDIKLGQALFRKSLLPK